MIRFLNSLLRPVVRHFPESVKAPLRYIARRSYGFRLAEEKAYFANIKDIAEDLPPIFHYWAHKYVRPQLEEFGFSNPDEFFTEYFARTYRDFRGGKVQIWFASIGSGNCDVEIGVAKQLLARGVSSFVIECVDINETMLARGARLAESEGVSRQVRFCQSDFNNWRPTRTYHAVMANQSLHHVVQLESLFDAIVRHLDDDGCFIVSDMIGRNGHMRWPEALVIVEEYWNELPLHYRYNTQRKVQDTGYVNRDYSAGGFEGIRAQDIMPLLVERFDAEFFMAHGNIIDTFVDRAFGHNFDVNSEKDLEFIDRLQARDELEIGAGRITPTKMMGVFRKKPFTGKSVMWRGLTPEMSIRRAR